MFEIEQDPKIVEAAYLLGVRMPGESQEDAEDHLNELAELVDTMGVPVVGSDIAPIREMNARWLVGGGKVEWIEAELQRLDADCLIFDEPLSPSQQRNWEKRLDNVCVIDRQEVILDIFAQRAQTQEARLQIQLARLEYSLPRLKRAWTHLERQRNARGVRGGMGEMQIEVDRRLVRKQIDRVKRDLETVRKQRSTQRKARGTRPMPVAAIVGYTNAGKSTLHNTLTESGVLCEDKLFATLDPTTRRVALPGNQEILLSDTVGFIRKLPHDLVEAFKATLEETRIADILVHVVDAGHPRAADHIAVTNATLDELDARDKPTILVLNKIDALESDFPLHTLGQDERYVACVSAKTGEGLDELLRLLAKLNPDASEVVRLRVPASRHDVVALVHREGEPLEERYADDGAALLTAQIPSRIRHEIADFIASDVIASAKSAPTISNDRYA